MQKREVLKLDLGGLPQSWIDTHEAAKHICEGSVVWSMGSVIDVLHGGYNCHGVRSVIEVPSIIAVDGVANINLSDVPFSVSREKVFMRDRNMCAYCSVVHNPRLLEAEHIVPLSRGGGWSWMNLVSACHDCNQFKANKTPEEAGMALLYLPYEPSYFENIIMEGRNIIADQMEFLLARVPKHSRLLLN